MGTALLDGPDSGAVLRLLLQTTMRRPHPKGKPQTQNLGLARGKPPATCHGCDNPGHCPFGDIDMESYPSR
jgi:hypothetical protein